MKQKVSPGGPHYSATKKRRLAVLDANLGKNQASQKGGGLNVANDDGKFSAQQPIIKDILPGNPPYNKLDASAFDGHISKVLQHGGEKISNEQGALDHVIDRMVGTKSLEQRASAGLRVQDKSILLDNPVVQQPGSLPRQQVRWSTQLMNRKERTRLANVQQEAVRYHMLQPLHALWGDYISKLLSSDSPSKERVLLQADYHGSCMAVVRSRDPQLLHTKGIIAKVTANTFCIVTPDDRWHVVPKQGCHFQVDLPGNLQVTIVGDQLVKQARRRHKQ